MAHQQKTKKMAACCSSKEKKQQHGLSVVVIGGGSAAHAAATKAHSLGASVVIINKGLPQGGCCVNVGCVPSKAMICAAEAIKKCQGVSTSFSGLETKATVIKFDEVVRQQQELVSALRQEKYVEVLKSLPRARYIKAWGKILNAHSVQAGDEQLKADAIIIATGSAPFVPPVPGLDQVSFLTNEDVFNLEQLPESMIVLGGRYMALECAQMFARFGTKVTILQRSDRILPSESPAVTDELMRHLQEEGITVVTGVTLKQVSQTDSVKRVVTIVDDKERVFEAQQLLLAMGRQANTRGLDGVGLQFDPRGFLQVDKHMCTNVAGVYGAGDVLGSNMFVYTAAYEGALAAQNALGSKEQQVSRNYEPLPWVVFTDPQVAGVGMDEAQALGAGVEVETSTLPFAYVPRALVNRDTRGLLQLFRAKRTHVIVGARVVAPLGSELMMEVSLAIKFQVTSEDLASMFHPYLAASEAVKLAALSFDQDVSKLSCCAH